MKENIKQEWLTALRSGKYSQAKRSLKTKDGYCCLGVLCDIAGEGKWRRHQTPDLLVEYFYDGYETSMESLLPSQLMDDLELGDDDAETLWTMNDGGATFLQVADYIEDNL